MEIFWLQMFWELFCGLGLAVVVFALIVALALGYFDGDQAEEVWQHGTKRQ